MKRTLFNSGWQFALKKPDEKPVESDFRPVDIPHDWLIADTHNLYADGDGYYRKTFTLTNTSGKVYILRFEGVYMDTTVYLNGSQVYEWKYGYTTFDVPLDVKEGENEVEVFIRHRSPNSRWYSGAGIFRSVYLTESGADRILPDGVYFCPEKTDDGWKAIIDTEVVGNGEAVLKHTISDMDGNAVKVFESRVTLGSETVTDSQEIALQDVHLWDVDDPYLYNLKTELIKDGETVYEISQRVGFKTVQFDANKGFFLNGRHLKINGACLHHDQGALGAAVNKETTRRQLEKMMEMGVNSIRTSHNPPSVELMDLADELGILIDSECFDMWELKKTTYDYARFFPEWHEKDVRSWIRRDRNHVSVIMWSIGNEIYDTHASHRGVELTDELTRCVHIDDYRHMHPVTIGSNYMAWEGAQNCAEHIETVGYNYAERLYNVHHEKHPEWVIYGSETASTIQSRGAYHFPASKVSTTHDDHQCSSLMNCATGWGAISPEYNIIQDRKHEFSLGQYIWTAWDYIGEPTPYWTKNSYFGHIDTAGFPKDSFYAYKAEWAKNAEPFVHLYPYWDFNEGQLIDLFIYSNCHESELFVNGVSKGKYTHDHINGETLSGRWKVPYEKGEIRAVGYDENGNAVCEQVHHSFGDPKKIVLTPNKTTLKANCEDLIFIEISMADENGYTVENARNRVNITVTGSGRLVGMDNGDSSDYGQYQETERKLFNGKLLAIIAATDKAGEITVTAESNGLPAEKLLLTATPAPKRDGVSCILECKPSARSTEIPVRKIDLHVSTQHITPDSGECVVTAEIFPKNSTFKASDIGFKIINDAGIRTNLAEVEAKDGKIVVVPNGDGEYRLRAYCKNGTEYEEIISEIEMKSSGFGLAGFDPYSEFVHAALHSKTEEELQDVFEGGVQTNVGRSEAWFNNVDFGKAGTDKVRVGLYLNAYDTINVEVIDREGNSYGKIASLKEAIWNHYQYDDIALTEKLTGVRDICFVISCSRQVRFQGFQFEKSSRIGELVPATSTDGVYGDAFEMREDCIAHIGNNVTVEFNDFDFGEGDVKTVTITGKTYNTSDTVHIRFFDENGQKDSTAVIFYGEEGLVTKTFDIPAVKDKTDVKLIYLPGCDFDLYSIEFNK